MEDEYKLTDQVTTAMLMTVAAKLDLVEKRGQLYFARER